MSDAGRAPNTTDFNPNFAPRLQAFRDALTKAGIQTTVASGYRSPEYQNQMYQNHLAQAAKRPLPYPNVEAPKVVAPAWQSFHNYGLAADVTPTNPADYKRMWDMAPQFGLTALRQKDMDHFQMSGSLGSNISQYKLAGWRPDSSPAPASGAIAYSGPGVPSGVQVASAGSTPIGTTINAASAPIAGGLAKPVGGGGGFLTSVANIESNDRNIPSTVDKDYPGQPGSKSQGHWQIDTPTWLQFGAAAGIDTTKYPNAMSAPRDIQEQVARTIPLSRFGGRTVKMLTSQYGALDKSQTLGALDAKYGGGAPGAAAASSSTGDTPPTTAAPAAAPAEPQSWWQQAYGKIVDKPVDAQGNPTGKPSPFENIASAFEKGPARMKALEEDQAPEQVRNYTGTAPPARNVSPGLANVSQTYGQTLNSFLQPLTWNDAPPQAPQMPAGGFRPAQAGQGPGISLNSVQPSPYGVGYGVNPVGFGFG